MIRRTFITWIAAGVIAVGGIGGFALNQAFAQDPTPPATTEEQRHGPGAHGKGQHQGQHKGRMLKALVRETARLTGMEAAQVREELQAGKSLAQIAEEHGTSADEIVNAVVEQAQERLDQAVAAGKITQEEATLRLEQIRAAAEEQVQQPGLELPRGPRHQKGGMLLIQATAEVTGLSLEQIREELQAGKSLAQIAEEHGKSADDILALLRTRGEERLNQMLERAREAIERVPER